MGENHSERNQRRRERNAFRNLYAYAQEHGIAEPKKTAERAAHAARGGEGGVASAPPAARAKAASSSGKGAAAAGAGRGAAAPTKAPAAPEKASRASAAAPAKEESVPHLLDDRTREQLYARAQELEIEGRSSMTKAELIEAIRSHS